MLPEYLEAFPSLKKHPYRLEQTIPSRYVIASEEAEKIAGKLSSGPDVSWIKSGETAALGSLKNFLKTRLSRYGGDRNDPNKDGTSLLSPYLHFGQLSSARAALEVYRTAEEVPGLWESADAYIEELVVRRELADNFCYYNPGYSAAEGFPDWARKTLEKHHLDPRPYIYSKKELESGETHDDLWNAAQRRLVQKGTMHGFLRMYWAKKILEWTASPEEALELALEFNDSYQLDGRDPNGYTGIAWAIGGVHDRPWKEREIFGTIRYMNYNGCKRKFDVAAYVNRTE